MVAIIAIAIIMLISACGKNSAADETKPEKETIKLTGGELGDYGRIVKLNEKSDSPVDKFLYKIPAGNYKVTTDFNKVVVLYIVKDEVQNTGSGNYPEELAYVGDGYKLSADKKNIKNGIAAGEAEITVGEDESILLVNTATIFLEKN